ncbi:YqaA family protein [Aquibaculum sediminis]|uniref:YqaA family protein n=1 Tax=Aquibaculum sediminis TaxID=3231907 RepID=UPI0034524AB4
MSPLRRLYDWTLRMSAHRHALAVLFLIAAIEASVFPIPPDVLIIPMILAARDKAWLIALVATAGSVLGGFLGYGIGWGLFETLGRPVLEFYGYAGKFADFAAAYNEWGAWIVAGAGFTPFPYKVITIASGATNLDPWVFALASLVSRAGRFFLVAALLYWFGPAIRRFIEAWLPQLTALFFVLLFGGFLALRYVF